jgi:hypothetical protein
MAQKVMASPSLLLAVILLVVGGLMGVIYLVGNSENTSTSRKQSTSNVYISSSAPSQPSSYSSTSTSLLATAKVYLQGQPSDYDLSEAKKRLEQIPPSAPEYQEAQRLLAQINAGETPIITQSPLSPMPFEPPTVSDESVVREIMLAVNKAITYEHLKKNADNYNGEPWAFTGTVMQIQESGAQTFALVSLDAWGNNLMAVRANFTTDFVEKNQVYVVGYLAGNYSYTSVAGWNMTVPLMEARAILKPSEATRIKASKK